MRKRYPVTVHSVTLGEGVERTETIDRAIQALIDQPVSLDGEIGTKRNGTRDKAGCRAIIAIWKLKDLQPNCRAPQVGSTTTIPNNPSRNIEFRARRSHEFVDVPRLVSIRVLKQGTDDNWIQITERNPLQGGDRIKIIIGSHGIEQDAYVSIDVVDSEDNPRMHFRGQISNDTTELEFDMEDFIVPNSPNNYVNFVAWIYTTDFNVESSNCYFRSQTANLSGSWIISSANSSNTCGEDLPDDTIRVEIQQNGNRISFHHTEGQANGTIVGRRLTWRNRGNDGEGIWEGRGSFDILEGASGFLGSETWTWNETGGGFSCSGTDEVSATRV